MLLARRMGLAETDISAIVEAARLHDIGLYAMSPSYHASPGPLSFEQRLDLWRHSVVGEQQMSKREAARHAQLLVRWHHEWWNGTGYPDQLAFEDIPIGARILRAVELYASLICERPYRPALHEAASLETLKASAGVECDPFVIAALLELLSELLNPEPVAREQITASGAQALPDLTTSVAQTNQISAAADVDVFAVSDDTPAGQTRFPAEAQGEPASAPSEFPGLGLSSERQDQTSVAVAQPERESAQLAERLLIRAKAKDSSGDQPAEWRDWGESRYNGKTLLGFEASVLRQIEFRSIAMPYWFTARLDWYLKTWGKVIIANDPSVWKSIAAQAMVESPGPLAEEQITRVLEDAYVPGARLNNPNLRRWFNETDAWWMDNLRRNADRLENETTRAQALLIGMLTGDYALSFDERTCDLRQPLATVYWRLAGRSVTVRGDAHNRSSNLQVEDFMRRARADLLFLKLPAPDRCAEAATVRFAWRESWVGGGARDDEKKPGPQSKVSYLASVERLLRLATHMKSWAIGYQESGLASAHDIAELIKEHRPIRATYSKDLTEVIGGLRSFIILA